jgi:hypothetical protein
MKVIYESGDVVKLQKTESAGDFCDCRVILLHEENAGIWKVRVHPNEGFTEKDSVGFVDESWFIPNFENLKR